jgi:formylglycine-generating enzyme
MASGSAAGSVSGSPASAGIVGEGGSGAMAESSVAEAGPTEPPSCAPGGPGLSDCGPDKESCCTSLPVPGGTFYRTYDPTVVDASTGVLSLDIGPDGAATGLADPATVSSFRLDKYDVTVGRFRQFVSAWRGGWRPTPGSGKHAYLNGGQGLTNANKAPYGPSGSSDAGPIAPGPYELGWVDPGAAMDLSDQALSTAFTFCGVSCPPDPQAAWTPAPGANEGMPMNFVTGMDSYAFCIWDGAFIPTEAELEYAQAGGAEQREYPWGASDPGSTPAKAIWGCNYPGDGGCGIAPVATAWAGAGLWGQVDLVGNVFQVVLDDCFSAGMMYGEPCDDCVFQGTPFSPGLTSSRGGAFEGDPTFDGYILSGSPGECSNGEAEPIVGFRCARAP